VERHVTCPSRFLLIPSSANRSNEYRYSEKKCLDSRRVYILLKSSFSHAFSFLRHICRPKDLKRLHKEGPLTPPSAKDHIYAHEAPQGGHFLHKTRTRSSAQNPTAGADKRVGLIYLITDAGQRQLPSTQIGFRAAPKRRHAPGAQ
jgi:hypothetical protein